MAGGEGITPPCWIPPRGVVSNLMDTTRVAKGPSRVSRARHRREVRPGRSPSLGATLRWIYDV